ncbi:MAG: hypothetical protein EZS28_015184 [Streblomastix strix]|uniref:Uncharacterized protein n=1 Tax=Streblomastix strix TaxID=222440 RepID=A0A5J4W337_9EUKA|nr:MAG: hypothetical protein EZS28_015184 [Streblomastix strix]
MRDNIVARQALCDLTNATELFCLVKYQLYPFNQGFLRFLFPIIADCSVFFSEHLSTNPQGDLNADLPWLERSLLDQGLYSLSSSQLEFFGSGSTGKDFFLLFLGVVQGFRTIETG